MSSKTRKLHIIEKILNEKNESILIEIETILKGKSPAKKPSDYAGCISEKKARDLLLHVEKSRNEWERDI